LPSTFTRKELLRLLTALVAGSVLFTLMLWYIGFEKISSAMLGASPLWVGASAAVSALFYLLRAYRWKIILIPVRNPTSLSNLFWITGVGYLVNTIIPLRIGEITRAILVDKTEETSFSGGLSSIAVERLLDLVAVASLGAIALYLAPQTLAIPEIVMGSLKALAALIILLIIILFLAVKFEEEIQQILHKLPLKAYWKDKIVGFAGSLIEAARSIVSKPSLMASSLILSWALWLFQFGAYYFLFKAFNYSAPIFVIFIGYIFLMATFILPAAPGYVGSFEAFWMLIFLALGLTAPELLLAMALTAHILMIVVVGCLGSLGASILGISLAEAIKVKTSRKMRTES
jgi:hypothetical protein